MKLILLLACLLFIAEVQAKQVEAEGHALITDDGLVKARALAIQDALQQATLMAGARVESTSTVNEAAMETSSVRVRAAGVVRDMVILDEWVNEDDEIYVVSIRAKVEDKDPDTNQLKEDNTYRRKIAVTQFQVLDRRQIHDMPNIEISLAKTLTGRLQQQNFFVVDTSDYLLPNSMGPDMALGLTEENIIVELASRLGVQFIVAGIIHDMGVTKHPMWVQFRHPEVQVFVLDGITGSLVSSHRRNMSVREGRPFDFPTTSATLSDKFFASPVGEAINKIVNDLVAGIASDLKQLPFTARVIQTKGKHVQIDVGSISKIKVGDKLMTYGVASDPTMGALGQVFMGFEEKALTTLTVKHVQPQFSIGELETEKSKLRVGDVVRFLQ